MNECEGPESHEEVAPPTPVPEEAESYRIPPDAIRGRRVTLVHHPDGGYQIWIRHRLIQTFCNDFEDVTRHTMPQGTEMPIRISIEPLADPRPYVDREQRAEVREETANIRMVDASEGPNLSIRPAVQVQAHQQGTQLHWEDVAIQNLRAEVDRINLVIETIAALGQRR